MAKTKQTEETKVEAKNLTPKALAEELGVDPKSLRSYLRSNFARSTEAKNTSWAIDEETATKVREHYAAKAAGADESEDEA